MHVVLIRAPEDELHDDRLDPPLGLMYVAAALETAGHQATIVDLCGQRSLSDVPEGDVYGISAFTTSYHVARKILSFLRARDPRAIVVAGGPHVSAVGGKVLSEGFDYAFVGEAEVTLPPVIDDIALRRLENPIIRGVELKSLDDARFTYSSIEMDTYSRKVETRRATTMLSARGCPFRCRFCWTPNNLGSTRFHSPEYVAAQLIDLRDRYDIRAIVFHDDSFLADRPRAFEIMDLVAELGFLWRAECNVLHLTPEVCDRLVATGCRHILCGVESGSKQILKAMKKPQNQAVMRQGIENAVRAGLTVRASLIVGFPGETWETVRESADFLCSLPFQEYSLYNFTPFPGTEPYEHPERFGIRWVSQDYQDYYLLKGFNKANCSFETDTINANALTEWREYMISRLNETRLPSVAVEGKWTIASEK